MTVLDPQTCIQYLDNYDLENVQPNSYDLRVSKFFEIKGGLTLHADGTKELPQYKKVQTEPYWSDWFILYPNRLYQFESFEFVNLPEGVCAITILRSSMNKSGASGEIGLYDSGYKGQCGMTISVQHTCRIQRGASIAQLLFFKSEGNRLYAGDYLDQKWSEKLLGKEG